MKRVLILALALIALPAFAQQAPDSEQELRRQATAEQRNLQADIVAALSAKMKLMQDEIERLKKAAESCKPEKK